MSDPTRLAASRPRRAASTRPRGTAADAAPDDRFFRYIVDNMRNGVIAVRGDGRVALMNNEAYRIFALVPSPDDIGKPFAEVLRPRPDAVRAHAGAFELSYLPNRAEFR